MAWQYGGDICRKAIVGEGIISGECFRCGETPAQAKALGRDPHRGNTILCPMQLALQKKREGWEKELVHTTKEEVRYFDAIEGLRA